MVMQPSVDLSLIAPLEVGWGKDELSQFFVLAEQQGWATFVRLREAYDLVLGVEELLQQAAQTVATPTNTEDVVPSFMLIRAHGAYLATVRLALCTQCPDSYANMRTCLENALYAFYMYKTPNAVKVWMNRHESPRDRKVAKREFGLKKLQDFLSNYDKQTGRIVSELYERTIDYGAHPNERAIFANMDVIRDQGASELRLKHLTDDSTSLRFSLKTSCEIGLTTMLVFENIFLTRFRLIGLSDRIRGMIRRVEKTRWLKL